MSIIFKDVKSIQTPMGFLREIKRACDGLVLWRSVKDLVGHTTVTLNPTEFDLGTSNKQSVEYKDKRPTTVTVLYKESGTSESIQLTKDTDYTLTYENDSGWISHNEEGEVLSTAYAVIDGMGDYFGRVKKDYIVKHTYKEDLSVKVTFDGNEGSEPDPKTKLVTVGKAYGDLATTSRTEYKFTGWYTAKTGGYQITKDTEVTNKQDHTLYAHWSSIYTSHFLQAKLSGTKIETSLKDYVVRALVNDQYMTSYTDCYIGKDTTTAGNFSISVANGYDIIGWSNGFDNPSDYDKTATSTRYTASRGHAWVWLSSKSEENTYTVKFDANGGDGSMEDQIIKIDTDVNLNPNKFTRSQYKFDGWSSTSTGNVEYTDEAQVRNLVEKGQSKTLYAIWGKTIISVTGEATGELTLAPGRYMITCVGNGGNSSYNVKHNYAGGGSGGYICANLNNSNAITIKYEMKQNESSSTTNSTKVYVEGTQIKIESNNGGNGRTGDTWAQAGSGGSTNYSYDQDLGVYIRASEQHNGHTGNTGTTAAQKNQMGGEYAYEYSEFGHGNGTGNYYQETRNPVEEGDYDLRGHLSIRYE